MNFDNCLPNSGEMKKMIGVIFGCKKGVWEHCFELFEKMVE